MNGQNPNFFVELIQQLYLAWRLVRDPRTPTWLKLLPGIGLIYVIFPEGFMGLPLLLTPIDDIVVMIGAIKGFIGLAPPYLVELYKMEMGLGGRDSAEANIIEGEIISSRTVNEKELHETIILNPDRPYKK